MSLPWRWARSAAGFAAVCYVGLQIRIPGIRPDWLSRGIWDTNDSALLKLFDKLSGKGISGGTVLALGITPYLAARVYFAIAKKVFPQLAAMDTNDAGHNTIKRWTRLLTVVLALVQSFGYAKFVQTIPNAVVNPGPAFVVGTMALLTVVSVLVMWLSELIAASEEDTAASKDNATFISTLHTGKSQPALNAANAVDEILRRQVGLKPEEVIVPK